MTVPQDEFHPDWQLEDDSDAADLGAQEEYEQEHPQGEDDEAQ